MTHFRVNRKILLLSKVKKSNCSNFTFRVKMTDSMRDARSRSTSAASTPNDGDTPVLSRGFSNSGSVNDQGQPGPLRDTLLQTPGTGECGGEAVLPGPASNQMPGPPSKVTF